MSSKEKAKLAKQTRILYLYNSGLSKSAIAKQLNYSYKFVNQVINQLEN